MMMIPVLLALVGNVAADPGLVGPAPSPATPSSTGLIPMPSFLEGCWQQRRTSPRNRAGAPARFTDECWMGPRGGTMLGSGREATGGRVDHWEWMRIERDAKGALTLFASLKGAQPLTFRAARGDDHSITFATSRASYPQKISYRLTADGLDATVSMADGSRSTSWHFRRLESEGMPAYSDPVRDGE